MAVDWSGLVIVFMIMLVQIQLPMYLRSIVKLVVRRIAQNVKDMIIVIIATARATG